jgi:hypothetical protein
MVDWYLHRWVFSSNWGPSFHGNFDYERGIALKCFVTNKKIRIKTFLRPFPCRSELNNKRTGIYLYLFDPVTVSFPKLRNLKVWWFGKMHKWKKAANGCSPLCFLSFYIFESLGSEVSYSLFYPMVVCLHKWKFAWSNRLVLNLSNKVKQ